MVRTELIQKLEELGWRETRGKGSAPNVLEFMHEAYPDADLMIWTEDDDHDEGTTVAHLRAGDVLLQVEKYREGDPHVGLIFTVYSQCADDVILTDLLGRGYR